MLPKIQHPLFTIIVPSTKEKMLFRPFLVKEEKILLIAQEGEGAENLIAIKQVIQNCGPDNLKIEEFTVFDLEYVFLKLRAKSVNNLVKLAYRDLDDDEIYRFELDLNTIEVVFNTENQPKIKINDELTMLMKYPSANITDKMTTFDNEVEMMTFVISNCIDQIYDSETIYTPSDYKQEELNEFLDSLDVNVFNDIKTFFETMPKLYHKLNYTNKNGVEKEIELTSLKDFFTWR